MYKNFVIPSKARNLLFSAAAASLPRTHTLPLRSNRCSDGFIHLVVSRAAAKIAAQSIAHIVLRRIRVLCQQRLHRHDESRRAIAALRAAPIAVSLLNRGQTPVLAHALNGRDFPALGNSPQAACRKASQHYPPERCTLRRMSRRSRASSQSVAALAVRHRAAARKARLQVRECGR